MLQGNRTHLEPGVTDLAKMLGQLGIEEEVLPSFSGSESSQEFWMISHYSITDTYSGSQATDVRFEDDSQSGEIYSSDK